MAVFWSWNNLGPLRWSYVAKPCLAGTANSPTFRTCRTDGDLGDESLSAHLGGRVLTLRLEESTNQMKYVVRSRTIIDRPFQNRLDRPPRASFLVLLYDQTLITGSKT
ncbi:hypothetical protein T265_09282 [Opisthorchis viverrini]|uniref:Uncharacterized protein n=1 Tax=Opisthorchis viverrini TaxID=6198 RepID=A0A074Z6K7_OPIVI|nr:hypothetical protein T265_09282 [Opisthorchis viverrini]KER22693.1 hypothetical protein T265_09282 [Opisthorchis viverrini]